MGRLHHCSFSVHSRRRTFRFQYVLLPVNTAQRYHPYVVYVHELEQEFFAGIDHQLSYPLRDFDYQWINYCSTITTNIQESVLGHNQQNDDNSSIPSIHVPISQTDQLIVIACDSFQHDPRVLEWPDLLPLITTYNMEYQLDSDDRVIAIMEAMSKVHLHNRNPVQDAVSSQGGVCYGMTRSQND